MSIPRSPLIPRAVASTFPSSGPLWRCGAVMAALGIAASSFGAHALKGRPNITPTNVQTWLTASHYLVYNGIALLAISMHPRFSVHRFSGPAIFAGALLFSGSLAATAIGGAKFKWLGPVAPLGGALMISGYISLAL